MKKIFLMIFFLTIIFTTFCKAGYIDVLHLKNGLTIKGIIKEQVPGEYVKILMKDNNILKFKMDEISKITKEEQEIVSDRTADLRKYSNEISHYYNNKKEKLYAFTWSCIVLPGAGHWYCGEVGRGLLFLGLDTGLILLLGLGGEDATVATTSILLLIGSRIFEIVDAIAGVDRYNRRLREELGIPGHIYLSFNCLPNAYSDKFYLGINSSF